MAYKIVFLLALLCTVLALGGGLAHAYELPNKMPLPRDEYFVVQKAYQGWNRLAFVLLAQVVTMVALAVLARRDALVLWPTLGAIACLVAAQAVFWTYTFPANKATANWTTMPETWESLRRQWEYSHLAGAGFQLLAFGLLAYAALARHVPES